MKDLTPKEKEIMLQIQAFKKQWQGSPTVADLARIFNISWTTMSAHIQRLEDKGYLKRTVLISKIEILKEI